MQRPILKDGGVVNIIELDRDTAIVTEARHNEMTAAEDADYHARLEAWQALVNARQNDLAEAVTKTNMARATVNALKAQSEGLKGRQATNALSQILALDKEVLALDETAKAISQRPLPPRPQIARAKRWFHPQGLEVGPAGGNIGDLWDGKRYSPLPAPAEVKPVEPVAKAPV